MRGGGTCPKCPTPLHPWTCDLRTGRGKASPVGRTLLGGHAQKCPPPGHPSRVKEEATQRGKQVLPPQYNYYVGPPQYNYMWAHPSTTIMWGPPSTPVQLYVGPPQYTPVQVLCGGFFVKENASLTVSVFKHKYAAPSHVHLHKNVYSTGCISHQRGKRNSRLNSLATVFQSVCDTTK